MVRREIPFHPIKMAVVDDDSSCRFDEYIFGVQAERDTIDPRPFIRARRRSPTRRSYMARYNPSSRRAKLIRRGRRWAKCDKVNTQRYASSFFGDRITERVQR